MFKRLKNSKKLKNILKFSFLIILVGGSIGLVIYVSNPRTSLSRIPQACVPPVIVKKKLVRGGVKQIAQTSSSAGPKVTSLNPINPSKQIEKYIHLKLTIPNYIKTKGISLGCEAAAKPVKEAFEKNGYEALGMAMGELLLIVSGCTQYMASRILNQFLLEATLEGRIGLISGSMLELAIISKRAHPGMYNAMKFNHAVRLLAGFAIIWKGDLGPEDTAIIGHIEAFTKGIYSYKFPMQLADGLNIVGAGGAEIESPFLGDFTLWNTFKRIGQTRFVKKSVKQILGPFVEPVGIVWRYLIGGGKK